MALDGSAPRRYAEAMFDLAQAAKSVEAYRASLDRLGPAFDAATIRALRDPGVPLAARRAAAAAATASAPEDVQSLIRLLVERDRIDLLAGIAEAYGRLVDRRDGTREARITTAVAIEAAHRATYIAELERKSGGRIRATFHVDPALLGGATVQIGDRLVDASLAGQLNALRVQLAS